MTKDNQLDNPHTERKRKELLQFIKTVGDPHIYTMYNFYLKECGCEAVIPDGPNAKKRST